MFKKILIAAGILGASLAFQAPAQADVKFGFQFSNGHYDHVHAIKHKRKHFKAKKHQRHLRDGRGHGYRHHVLSNREIRYRLRDRGLYNIRFIDRFDGVAKVVARNHRGHLAKYRVSTRSGRIISGRVIRPSYGYRSRRGFRSHISY